ncbi:glycosyltransferase family 4 protein (plasmid) [Halarchaeum sp. CBA1220]|uniref:glycosyltransferase family 4 protein n=1 Tax=Halarchaeum sp. CBA1220 TaxID=1853682 RepID=UPI000F3A8490|nr:glycosyltransferase family 4 protein [Halarchaeum sp. CBA1220]QLC35109.1 glycosyltransferase family 4 protein [Halarchaeum sp. CBA1220]
MATVDSPAILVVTPDFPPNGGGIGSVAYNYCKYTSLNADVLTSGNDERDINVDQVDIHTVPNMSGLRGLLYCLQKIQSINKKYDVLYFTHPFYASLGCAFPQKVCVHVHGNSLIGTGMKKEVMKRLSQVGLRSADGIIANSSWTQAQVELSPTADITVIHPGVSPSLIALGKDSGPRSWHRGLSSQATLLTVGRLVKRKGHREAIRAISNFNVDYYIVGAGEMEQELKRLVKSLEMGDQVHFEGYVPEDDLPEYYARSDLFVMPSMFMKERGSVEGFGIVFLEANSFGVPVIGGNTGGVPSAIVPGETGLLVQPDADSVSDAISRLLSNAELYERCSDQGMDWAAKHSWNRIVEQMDEYIKSI